MTNRPRRVVAVLGTATEIGKTYTTARLLDRLVALGVHAVARKPAQSFDPDDDEPTDAMVLATATGELPETVCPRHRWYAVPLAPPMAADVLGRPKPMLRELVTEITWPPHIEIGFVESVGGVRSPVADDGDSCDLARAVEADVALLVADAGLGTIGAVRLGADALAPMRVIVYLNRFDAANDLHCRNAEWLRVRDGIDVQTTLDEVLASIQLC